MNNTSVRPGVLILTERFFPETFLINDLAAEWKRTGMEPEILTQVPSYPKDKVYDGYVNKLFQTTAEFNAVRVHRVKTCCGYNRSLFRKIFNYLNFAFLTSLWCLVNGWRYRRVFVYHTGPLTMACAALIMHYIWRRRCVIWTQDIWPDAVYAYGFRPTWWKRLLLNSFVRLIYSGCDDICVSSPVFAEKLSAYTQKQIHFVPQWNSIDFDKAGFESRNKPVPGGRVFTFAGNMGTVQNLETIVEAFGELKLKDCVLQMVGGGVSLEKLQKQVQEKGYENILFTGHLPPEKMPQIFDGSDFMILSLKKDFDMTIPAKFQAYISAGKPILGIIGGDTAGLIRKFDLGMVCETDKESIQKAFIHLASVPEDQIRTWEKNSSSTAKKEFNREMLIGKIKDLVTVPPQENSRGKTALILFGIMVLASALMVYQRIMEPEMGRDSSFYLQLIQYWHEGGLEYLLKKVPFFWIPPLMLYLATGLTHLGLSPETAAVGLCMFCGILMPLAVFAVAHEIFHNRKISLAAALLTAVNPSIIEMAVQVQRDVPYLLFVTLGIFLIIRAIRREKWYWWCVAGFVTAAGTMVRFETLELLGIAGIFFFVALWKKQQKWSTLLRDMALYGVCTLSGILLLLCVTGTLFSMGESFRKYLVLKTEKLQEQYKGGSVK